MSNTDDDMRKAFEAWFKRDRGYTPIWSDDSDDAGYHWSAEAHMAFKAYQAATLAERERIAKEWDGRTYYATGLYVEGADIGASIRAGKLVDME